MNDFSMRQRFYQGGTLLAAVLVGGLLATKCTFNVASYNDSRGVTQIETPHEPKTPEVPFPSNLPPGYKLLHLKGGISHREWGCEDSTGYQPVHCLTRSKKEATAAAWGWYEIVENPPVWEEVR